MDFGEEGGGDDARHETRDLKLRPADPEDLPHMVRLVDLMGEGPALQFWRGQALPIERAWQGNPPGVTDWRGETSSWRSSIIADVRGTVAGLVVIAPVTPHSTRTDRLPGLVRPLQALEDLVPGSLCVHVLSVYPAFRRRGLAARLLRHAIGKSGGREISAVISDANVPGMALFAAAGFDERARRPAGEGAWVLLLRPAETA